MNIPEGWKLVPVEPTPEMIEAAKDNRLSQPGGTLPGSAMRQMFVAMLDAAPTPHTINDVVVTTDETGRVVAVTRQDEEGKILSVIWEAPTPPAQEVEPVAWVEVTNRCEGPYRFHGVSLMDVGRHNLYTSPSSQKPAWSESGDPLNLEAAAERLLNCLENETVNKDIEKEMDNLRKFLGES